jgi:hypothetical protein
MVNHWQIQSALLEEARLGRSLVGNEGSRNFLPFNEDDLLRMVGRLHVREKHSRMLERSCVDHWVAQFFFRAFYFGQAKLPQTFRVVVEPHALRGREEGTPWSAVSLDHGIRFAGRKFGPEGVDGTHDVQQYDLWEVEIEEVNLYDATVWVTPKKLLWRAAPDHALRQRIEMMRGKFSSSEVFVKPTYT